MQCLNYKKKYNTVKIDKIQKFTVYHFIKNFYKDPQSKNKLTFYKSILNDKKNSIKDCFASIYSYIA